MSARNGSTRAWRRTRTQVLAASSICHLCGHDQADAVDHVTARARGGTDHTDNLKPAHHQPCPTCGIRCNLIKSARVTTPQIRHSGSLNHPGGTTPTPPHREHGLA